MRQRCLSLTIDEARKRSLVLFLLFTVIFAILMATAASSAYAQQEPGRQQMTLDAAARGEIIDSALTVFADSYVFPEMAEKMAEYIRKRQREGVYDTLTDPMAFTFRLTEDLREMCHDKHLGVRFSPDLQVEDVTDDGADSEAARQRRIERMRRENFGFYRVERMEGNVGYVDLRGFEPAKYGGPTAVAAMNFLANCDAIIFDLRKNGGGSPSMIQLISSYFFEEPVHLNNFFDRNSDSIQQFWTQAHVQGPRMADMPLYILTSDYTFSAAEEFSYNMRNLERATLIGETTGGGAHPVQGISFPRLKIVVRVPFARAINPISGTNWEGVGVKPHIDVPEAQALDRALVEAYTLLRETADNPMIIETYDWFLAGVNARLSPVVVADDLLKAYAGTYGPRVILYEDGQLFYQREDRPKYRLLPLAEDLFRLDGLDRFRIRIERDDSGRPIALIGLYEDSPSDRTPRD